MRNKLNYIASFKIIHYQGESIQIDKFMIPHGRGYIMIQQKEIKDNSIVKKIIIKSFQCEFRYGWIFKLSNQDQSHSYQYDVLQDKLKQNILQEYVYINPYNALHFTRIYNLIPNNYLTTSIIDSFIYKIICQIKQRKGQNKVLFNHSVNLLNACMMQKKLGVNKKPNYQTINIFYKQNNEKLIYSQFQKILIPINVKLQHFMLIMIEKKQKSFKITFFNSDPSYTQFQSQIFLNLRLIIKYQIQHFGKDNQKQIAYWFKKSNKQDYFDFQYIKEENVSQQKNEFDCGVHICFYTYLIVKSILKKTKVTYKASDDNFFIFFRKFMKEYLLGNIQDPFDYNPFNISKD